MTEEEKQRIHQRDLEILNANAEYFNAEAEDVLQYQAEVDFEELDEAKLDESVIVGFSEADLEK